jgi:hypothetical protein
MVLLDQHKNSADYAFIGSEKRKNLSDRSILPLGKNKSEAFVVNAQKTENIGEQSQSKLLPFKELDDFVPSFPDDGKSVVVTYRWRNMPFYLPEKSEKHHLYKQWETEKGKILSALDSIFETIEKTKKEEEKWSTRIIHIILGKKQKFSEYTDEVENLKQLEFSSLKPEDLKVNIDRISEIFRLVKKDMRDIAEENRKARLDEEIEQLKQVILEQDAELREKQEKKEGDEKKETELKKKISLRNDKLKQEQREYDVVSKDVEKKIGEFCTRYKVSKNELSKFKEKLTTKAGEKHEQQEE